MSVWAETMPDGYYDAIQGQRDSVLKTTLHLLIRGGERYAYGPATYHTTNNTAKKDSVSPSGEITTRATPYGAKGILRRMVRGLHS